MPHDDANWFRRMMRWLAGTAPMAGYGSWTAQRIDRLVYQLTGSRFTLTGVLTGIPVVLPETVSARSGQSRSRPVLGIPDADNLTVIASSFGPRHQPAWYYNLVAHPEATVTIGRVRHPPRARLAQGEERQRLWELGQNWYPPWPRYGSRAGLRTIPIFVLEPSNKAPDASERRRTRSVRTARCSAITASIRSLERGAQVHKRSLFIGLATIVSAVGVACGSADVADPPSDTTNRTTSTPTSISDGALSAGEYESSGEQNIVLVTVEDHDLLRELLSLFREHQAPNVLLVAIEILDYNLDVMSPDEITRNVVYDVPVVGLGIVFGNDPEQSFFGRHFFVLFIRDDLSPPDDGIEFAFRPRSGNEVTITFSLPERSR